MDLYGQKSKSIPQKILIHLIEIILLWLSYRILFRQEGDWIAGKLHWTNAANSEPRRWLIFIFIVITFFRLSLMMLVFLKRKIPWEESISVPFAFALYYIGFSVLVLPTTTPIDWLDYLAMVLFVGGSVLNTGGELLRYQWKKNPANKGKIYTQGFFKYARHINYFGDLLWVIAFALITRNGVAVVIPAFLFCFFAFYNAPKLDKYLAAKYGHGYEEYAKKTKMLVPFIY